MWTNERTMEVLQSNNDYDIQQSETENTTTTILVIHNPRDPDESNYTCSGVNNVTNVVNSPEQSAGQLFVEG